MAQVDIQDELFAHLRHIAEKLGKNIEDVVVPILHNYIVEVEGPEHILEEQKKNDLLKK